MLAIMRPIKYGDIPVLQIEQSIWQMLPSFDGDEGCEFNSVLQIFFMI